jgi:aspartate aminotransferase
MSLVLNEKRLSAVKPSATLEMSRKAKAMRADGIDVKNLSAGEPDLPMPSCIADAADEAVRAGATRYTPSRGTADVVHAMREKYKRDQGIEFSEQEVMATVGTKGALSLAIDALVGEGDEVILFSPYWVTYPDLVRLAGGTPVKVKTRFEDGFLPDLEAFAAAITENTKLVILNTPGNPTGRGLPESFLRALMGQLEGTGIWVISDEIYERLVYGDFSHVSPAQISDDAKSRTLIVGGVAKAYAMTGWRLGCAAGPSKLIDAMIVLQQQRLSCPTASAQAAAAYALREPKEVADAADFMRGEFEKRRELALAELSKINGLRVYPPDGAFYLFVDAAAYLPGTHAGRRIESDTDLCTLLLQEAHVATVPGTPFGTPGGFRMSYAASADDIKEAIGRVSRFMAEITAES